MECCCLLYILYVMIQTHTVYSTDTTDTSYLFDHLILYWTILQHCYSTNATDFFHSHDCSFLHHQYNIQASNLKTLFVNKLPYSGLCNRDLPVLYNLPTTTAQALGRPAHVNKTMDAACDKVIPGDRNYCHTHSVELSTNMSANTPSRHIH